MLFKFGMCVGVGLRMIVLSGEGWCFAGFLALFLFVDSCRIQWTTLFDRGGLCCVMCSSRVCFVCIGGCRFLVRMSLVLSCVATPPILISPLT